jgi:hypothetical protein
MAAKTFATVGTNGWVRPERELYGGTIAGSQDILVNGAVINLDQLSRFIGYVADIDNTDTVATGISGIQCVAVVTADANGTVTPSVGWDAAGILTFASSGSNWAGWVILWITDPTNTYGKKSG